MRYGGYHCCCCCCYYNCCCYYYPHTLPTNVCAFLFIRRWSVFSSVFYSLKMLCFIFERVGEWNRRKTAQRDSACVCVCARFAGPNSFHENQFHSQNKRRLLSERIKGRDREITNEWNERAIVVSCLGANGHFRPLHSHLKNFPFQNPYTVNNRNLLSSERPISLCLLSSLLFPCYFFVTMSLFVFGFLFPISAPCFHRSS